MNLIDTVSFSLSFSSHDLFIFVEGVVDANDPNDGNAKEEFIMS
jgi:hypothetical protein